MNESIKKKTSFLNFDESLNVKAKTQKINEQVVNSIEILE